MSRGQAPTTTQNQGVGASPYDPITKIIKYNGVVGASPYDPITKIIKYNGVVGASPYSMPSWLRYEWQKVNSWYYQRRVHSHSYSLHWINIVCILLLFFLFSFFLFFLFYATSYYNALKVGASPYNPDIIR